MFAILGIIPKPSPHQATHLKTFCSRLRFSVPHRFFKHPTVAFDASEKLWYLRSVPYTIYSFPSAFFFREICTCSVKLTSTHHKPFPSDKCHNCYHGSNMGSKLNRKCSVIFIYLMRIITAIQTHIEHA